MEILFDQEIGSWIEIEIVKIESMKTKLMKEYMDTKNHKTWERRNKFFSGKYVKKKVMEKESW
jgi:hypothetical protein